MQTWHDLNKRVRLQPEYAGVRVLISKSDFVAWAEREFAVWFESRTERPSVDRIRPERHYEAGNLRVISLTENCRRARKNKNVHAPAGQAWCGKCEKYKPVAAFERNRSKPNGLQGRCRACRGRTTGVL